MEGVREAKWGEQSRHRSLGAPLGKYAPLSARPSGAAARVAAAGATPLARQQKHPAVENVKARLQANQWFSSEGM